MEGMETKEAQGGYEHWPEMEDTKDRPDILVARSASSPAAAS